jgi:hypothetical protein
MGGSGSGNWYRFDSKTLTEHCCSIDVRQLSRWGSLKPWLRYPLKWNNGSNIVVETKPGVIELSYGISHNGQPREDVHIVVPLTWSSCNYGGERPWFICPGKGCGRRVAKLYLAGKYFLCRHCYDLVYSSQRQAKAFRLLEKAQKICRRLGANNCDDLHTTQKPKGMHWRTYEKLVDEAQEVELESLHAISQKLNIIHDSVSQIDDEVNYGSTTSQRR